MYYNHNLRVNLKEWRNRLIKSNYDQFDNAHKYFFDKVRSVPALFSFILESSYIPSDESLEEIDFDYGRPEWRFTNEEHEAVLKFYLIEYLLKKPNTTITGWLFSLVGGG